MKKIYLVLVVIGFFTSAPIVTAQEKPKTEQAEKRNEPRRDITPVRVQVVFNEFEGEKKISSLPYSILINADDRGASATLRMGLRVPIQTGGSGPSPQFQYIDMGTNMDGRAEKDDEGRFVLHLSVERSSAYSPSSGQKPQVIGGTEITNLQPVIQQFKTNINLRIRDGQTMQSTISTNPITGGVLKIDVTLNVLK